MSAGQVDRLALLLLGAGLLAASVVLLRRYPRLVFLGWIGVVCFVPVWFGISLGPFFPLVSLATLGALIVLVRPGELTWLPGDWFLAAIMAACLSPLVFGGSTVDSVFQLLTLWFPALLLGRVVATRVPIRWIYGAVGIAFGIVAVLALVEFATQLNPFLRFPASSPSAFAAWGTLQTRGGLVRVEGAFGHSIALGSCLAMAIPLTLASRLRPWLRLVLATAMVATTVFTFSRVSMLGAVLGVLLSALLLRDELSRRYRMWIIAVVVAGGAALTPSVLRVFDAAGAESTNSALYRAELLTLVPSMAPFGFSPIGGIAASGRLKFGTFRSIDSALILSGLVYGWVALALICVGLLAVLWLVVRGRATAPTIAVACQIPTIATVALITQYAVFFWFVVGLAVVAQHRRTERAVSNGPPADAPPGTPSRKRAQPPVERVVAGTVSDR